MAIAKVFKNGQSQAVRLPRDFRFSENEVCIKRVGYAVMLYPKSKEKELLMSSLGQFTDDFFESIAELRESQASHTPRELSL